MEISRRKEIYLGKRRGNWCCGEEGCMGGARWLRLLYPCAQTLGTHLGLLQVSPVPHSQGCSLAHPPPRQKLLPEPTSALLLLCFPTPWSPSCHPSISAFISLYNFSVPSEVLLPSLLLHVFHFSYHKCHSHTANTRSATTFL